MGVLINGCVRHLAQPTCVFRLFFSGKLPNAAALGDADNEQGKYYVVPKEELEAIWNNPENEKQFNLETETMQKISKAAFEAKGVEFYQSVPAGDRLTKLRED